MAARLKERYKKDIFPALQEKFHYNNVMEVPKLEKITLNMGLGDCKDNPKLLEMAVKEMAIIAGQAPVVTKSRKSIAFFNIALPRVRDFKGVSANSFDGRGNYSMGVKEQLIFPEIVYDQVEKIRGMDIVFTTTAKTDEEAKALLELLGMPFEK